MLNRDTEVDALDALIFAMRPESSSVEMSDTAIAFDTNVFLRLSKHERNADILDYLRTAHAGPLILPGQVIQEFWNNQFSAVDSLASSIKKKFDQLKSEVQKIDESFGDFTNRFTTLMDEFSGDYGYIYDDNTLARIRSSLDILKNKATVPFAPRHLFLETAELRKATKTPPGFKDNGHGDFFVWVDLLTGLREALNQGSSFKRVVLVSQDSKVDWSRDGTPHPILIAEMKALTGASFEIWSLDKLAKQLLD